MPDVVIFDLDGPSVDSTCHHALAIGPSVAELSASDLRTLFDAAPAS